MDKKKWNILFFISLLLFYLFSVSLHYMVNPYLLFDNSITDKKFFDTKEYSKKLFEALKDDKHTLVFGNSRTSLISSDMLNEKVLNLTMISPLSYVYNFLTQLSPTQINNIKKVYHLLDVNTFNNQHHKKHIKYNAIDYKQNMLDIFKIQAHKIKGSIIDITYNYIVHPTYYIHKDGSSVMYSPTTTFQNSAFFDTKQQSYSEDGLSEFIKINNFYKNNNIKPIYFTATFMDLMFKQVDLDIEKKKFKYLLDNTTLGFHALLYLDGFSNLKNGNHYLAFVDASHLNTKYVKKKLLEVIHGNKYFISNNKELDIYFEYLKNIQNKL